MSRISPTRSLAGKALAWSWTPTIPWIVSRSACGSRPSSRIVPASGAGAPRRIRWRWFPRPVRSQDAEDFSPATDTETSSTATRFP